MQDDLVASERIIAGILRKLSKSGVRRVALTPDEFGFDGTPDHDLFHDAVLWLVREGLITADDGHDGGYESCALTAAGFTVLGKPFQVSDGEIRLSEAVERVGSGEASYVKAGNFFGGFTRSIGS